ncbi:MAG: DUF5320 domain-containing protein [Victivallales bacterium]|nr:DUF5320 domain-containing protein [Victivallales bacterium]
MPGGDRTGPAGMGPMTGRAAGYCAGYPTPGFMNPISGFGFRRGMRLGFRGGRGRGGFRGVSMPFGVPVVPAAPYTYGVPFDAVPTREQALDALKGQAEYLENALNGVKKQIAELQEKEAEK